MRRLSFSRPVAWLVFCGALLSVSLAWAGDGWTPRFAAGFSGVPDGPGEGDEFPAHIGRLEGVTQSGDPFRLVSPLSGIRDEVLVLTDDLGRRREGFGVFAASSDAKLRHTRVRFDVTLLKPSTTFAAEVTDTTGVDISVVVKKDGIAVNGEPIASSTRVLVPLEVEIQLIPNPAGEDWFILSVHEALSGELVGEWGGPLAGGMNPVTGVLLWKSGASPGAVALDNIIIATGDSDED